MSAEERYGLLQSQQGEDAAEAMNERATREGFAKQRVVWFGGPGDWERDWLFYVENSHTLVSMCRGHALHPFDRYDRVCYLCCVLCMNLFISAWLQRERDEVARLEYYWSLVVWSVWLVVYDNVLRLLATSPCFQLGGSLYSICWLCRDCCLDCGRQGLYVLLVLSVGIALAGLIVAVHNRVTPERFFATFFVMRVLSYLWELAPISWTFYARRESQREYWTPPAGDATWTEGGAYPLGARWPTPDYLFERRVVPERFAHASKRNAERNAQARRRRGQERSRLAQRLKDLTTKRADQSAASSTDAVELGSVPSDDVDDALEQLGRRR